MICISSYITLQDFAISIAVSYIIVSLNNHQLTNLSPVSIQNLILASNNLLIVAGTPSYNLSSIAVHPKYLSFYSILLYNSLTFLSLYG
jgi:hypothetical protein